MKNTLMIPLVFIANLVIWVCSIAFFSVLGTWRYLEALIGGNARLFFLICGYRAVSILPLAIMLALVMVFLFLMRHRSLFFVSVPLVLAMVGALVFFVLPYSYTVLSLMETRFPDAIHSITVPASKMFSPDIIRSDLDTDARWLDISAADSPKRSIVVAHTGQTNDVLSFNRDVLYDADTRSLSSGSSVVVSQAGGIDPLYADYLALPRFVRTLVADVVRVLDAFRVSNRAGIVPFLWTAGSFFAAVTALWLLCYGTGWRMLNVLLIFASLRFLFFGYPLTIAGKLYDVALKFTPRVIPATSVSSVFYLAFAAVLVLAGACIFLIRTLRHLGSEASYG